MPVPSSFFHQKYCEDADQVYEDLAAYVERGERGELLYSASGKAEDLRYHDSESGTEVSISAWEFLNEDLKASDDMVLAPSEAVILRSKIKKKSTNSSNTTSPPRALRETIVREKKTSKSRSGANRRGMAAGILSTQISAAQARKMLDDRRERDPLRSGGARSSRSPNSISEASGSIVRAGLVRTNIPMPSAISNVGRARTLPQVSVAIDKSAVLDFAALRVEDLQSKRAWVGVAEIRNDGNCAAVFRVTGPSFNSSELPQRYQGHAKHSGDLPSSSSSSSSSKQREEITWWSNSVELQDISTGSKYEVPCAPQITPKFGVLACGGGKAQIKFHLTQDDAKKLKAHLSVIAENAAASCHLQTSTPVSAKPQSLLQSNDANATVLSTPTSKGGTAFDIEECLGSAHEALQRWINGTGSVLSYKLEVLPVGAAKREDLHEGSPKVATDTITSGFSSTSYLSNASPSLESDRNYAKEFEKARSGGPVAAQKLFESLDNEFSHAVPSTSTSPPLSSSCSDSHSPSRAKESTKIQRCERRLDCRYAIDIHDFVLNIPSLAAKAEAERRRLKRKELLSSSSDAKRQRNEKVGVHSDRKDNRRSKSSNRDGGSSRDEDLKNTGDLSKEAIRAGWRMKLSARHEGKPYYYRLK